MTELFGIDIAAEINDALGDDLLPATLHQKTHGDRGGVTGGRSQVVTEYPTTGVVTGYSERFIDGTRIRSGDRQVRLIGARLPIEPSQGDQITIEGATYNVISVDRDAAAAMFVCQCRR